MNTVVPGILTVGLFDQTFSHNPSATAHQPLPATIRYVPGADHIDECDVVLATPAAVAGYPCPFRHPRKALWLIENREFEPHPPRSAMDGYDLVLANDAALVADLGPRARWLSLIGTWLPLLPQAPKTCGISMISSAKRQTSGHRLRHEVAALRGMLPHFDGYGPLFGTGYLPQKADALAPYRFTIVIEPAAYDCLVTEKVCDAFAARCVPIFWGPRDLTPLSSLGFDISGILRWTDVKTSLRDVLHLVTRHGEAIYADHEAAIETNYRRARELATTETLLEPLLRDYFDLR